MTVAEKEAVRQFAAYAVHQQGLSFIQAARWGIRRLRKGLIPVAPPSPLEKPAHRPRSSGAWH